ncbi:MAG: metal ABC transporter permease [Candidatus Malihini olakiniferum]
MLAGYNYRLFIPSCWGVFVIAMLIEPGLVAFIVCKTFNGMLIVSTCVSVFSSVVGTVIIFPGW